MSRTWNHCFVDLFAPHQYINSCGFRSNFDPNETPDTKSTNNTSTAAKMNFKDYRDVKMDAEDDEIQDCSNAVPPVAHPALPSADVFDFSSILMTLPHLSQDDCRSLTTAEIINGYYSLEHRHAACLHVIDKQNYPTWAGCYPHEACLAALGTQHEAEEGDIEYIVALLHPRWCAKCLDEREVSLKDAEKIVLDEIITSANHEEFKEQHILYVRALMEGRIHALSDPLYYNEARGALGIGMESDMLPVISNNLDVREEAMDDLEKMMEIASVGWNEAEHQMYQKDALWDMALRGNDDGRGLQARFEKEALYHVDTKTRARLFRLSKS